MPDVEIAGQTVSAGSKRHIVLPVTEDLAMPIEMDVHVVAGASEGPTLTLLSMLHGNEWFSVLILRQLMRELDPKTLAGNLIAIPVANQAASLPELGAFSMTRMSPTRIAPSGVFTTG